MQPPIVYLDTQDLSEFGNVLRGKSDTATERLFLELERRAQTGEAIFPVSMPLLSELLQYDPDFRETTLCKANAVERLSGRWALAFPGRLVAADIAGTAARYGFLPIDQKPSILSNDRYWFPNVGDILAGLSGRMRAAAESKVAELELPTRVLRRKVKKLLRSFSPVKAAREIAPEFAAKYDLPIDAVFESIIPLLRNQITAETASRRLFGAIAKPTRFVETYFERVETDRTFLPNWMRGFGADLQAGFVKLRTKLEPFFFGDAARNQFDNMLCQWPEQFGRTVLKFAVDDMREFGLDPELFQMLVEQKGFVDDVPASHVAGRILVAYI